MANLVNLTIDGKPVTVPSTYTILKAAESIGIFIPRLCFLEGIHEQSNCRICIVKVEGLRGLKTSCSTKVAEGMVVLTDTKEVYEAVSFNLELLAGNHKFECWKCSREDSCEFLDLLRRFNVDNDFSNAKLFDQKEIKDTYIFNDPWRSYAFWYNYYISFC